MHSSVVISGNLDVMVPELLLILRNNWSHFFDLSTVIIDFKMLIHTRVKLYNATYPKNENAHDIDAAHVDQSKTKAHTTETEQLYRLGFRVEVRFGNGGITLFRCLAIN